MTCDDKARTLQTRDSRRRLVGLLLFGMVGSTLCVGQAVRLNDDSDWWSTANETRTLPKVDPQTADTDSKNFRILGVSLGENQFQDAGTKLGRATMIDRGDAGAARHHVCYVATKGQERVHLIFEKAEVEYAFYLFDDGKKWQGEEYCALSLQLLPAQLTTESGLRLGQTPAQVEAILGKPTAVLGDKLVYSREMKKRASDASLKGLRAEHPEMPESEFHKNYDFADFGVYIEADFLNSKLDYLAVSEAETY